MTRQKRASSTTDLTNPEPSDDSFLTYSPTAHKRIKCNKTRHAGDGWLWRPSGPRIPSPNASPLPLRWDRPSPSKSKFTVKRRSDKKSKSKQKTKNPKDPSHEVDGFNSSPPSFTSRSGTITIGTNGHTSDEEGQVSIKSNIDNIGHTPGPGAKMKRNSTKSTEDLKAASDQGKTHGTKTKNTVTKSIEDDLKALSDRIKTVEEKADKPSQELRSEIASLKESIQVLEERTQRNEMRAAIRHDIIFDVIKKISHDVNKIRSGSSIDILSSSESISGGSSEVGSASPPPKKKPKRSRSPGPQKAVQKAEQAAAARQTMERCLNQYTEDLNSASTLEEVKKCGELCKKYAENLVKNYI